MKHTASVLFSLSALLLGREAWSKEGRFDSQVFRPSAAPRDLVMVQKSEVMGHLSPTIGIYYDLSFDPLVFVNKDTNQTVSAVASRLTLTGLAGFGFFDWFDVTLAMPFVAWQSSDNLRSVGTEGTVQTPALGDLRLSTKLRLPYLNRRDNVRSGFGMALTGNVNLPTGSQNAFMSDGFITGGTGIIADYRWSFGLLVGANLGLWIRPEHQFAGVKIGDMAQVGVAAEQYVVRKWGLSVIGEVYGYPSLTSFPDSPKQVPAEVLLGIRWQTKHGITITFGGSFGAACGFGAPAIRFFNSITWQPKSSVEQEEIERIKQAQSDDPDGDKLIGDADRCPDKPGPPENHGCPDGDRDNDGIADRDDECPDTPGGPHGKKGCPSAFIRDNEIVIMDQIHFATDKDIILDESKPVIEEVAVLLINNPQIRLIEIEGHTDVRASDAYNINLSQRRVNSVMAYLVWRGVDPSRLTAKGYGHTKPVVDDTGCIGTDQDLSEDCRTMTSKNRRVVFRILKIGAPPPRALSGAPDGNGSVLPSSTTVLPSQSGTLPSDGVLKQNSSLPSQPVLPRAADKQAPPSVLPNKGESTLPNQGSVLPRAGMPAPPPSTAPQQPQTPPQQPQTPPQQPQTPPQQPQTPPQQPPK